MIICKLHGKLDSNQVVGKKRIRCKECEHKSAKEKYEKNKQHILAYRKEWRKKRKEQGYLKSKPRKSRKIYDPNAEGNIWECDVHGWLKKDDLYFRKENEIYVQAQCKKCTKLRLKKIYEKNSSKIIQRQKENRLKFPEKYAQKYKEYYYKNIDISRKRAKEYAAKNKEKKRITSRIYREQNKDKIRERNRKYIFLNREKIRENHKKYVARKRDHLKQKRKEWEERNKEILALKDKEYQAKQRKELHKVYIKTILLRQFGSFKNIPDSVVDLKRVLIEIHRLTKKRLKKNE